MVIIHLDLLRTLLGTQLADLAIPIVCLMAHGQVSTFLEEVFQFLPFVLATEMANLLVISSKQSKVLPGREKGNGRPVNQCSN